MLEDVSDQVYALVARECGIKAEKLDPGTTLSHDLGMEGDDAVEFFEEFQRQFSVDLRQLGEDWSFYFAPEGLCPISTAFVLALSFCLAYLLHRFLLALPFWVCLIAVFLIWIGAMYLQQKILPPPEPQITLQDLVDCVKAKTWTKELPAVIEAKRKKHYSFFRRSAN